MRMTGLSEVIGSWKTIATSVPQIVRLSFSLAPTTSKPSIIDEPVTVVLTRGCSPMIVRDEHRLARTGFADDAEGLVAFEVEGDAVHRGEVAAAWSRTSS